MELRSWLESELWDENYFDPRRLSEGVEVFRSGLSFPLITSLIDGCRGTPEWVRQPHETHSDALFRSLRGLVRRYGASWLYITDPDNALSVFEWEKEIDPDYFNSHPLIEFEKNPAQEGGASFLCIGFHDREGLVVIERETTLKITLHANPERMAEILTGMGIERPVESKRENMTADSTAFRRESP